MAQPHGCPNDPDTMMAGVAKRFATKVPKPDRALLKEFRKFVRKEVRTLFKPLSPDSDVTVETWLKGTNYTASRQAELLRKWKRVVDPFDPKYTKCKSFMKDETYPEFKHVRAINSRTDEFKCLVGPIFKLIEKVVYEHEAFIKHVPVKDRPDYIMKKLFEVGSNYGQTDFSSFESSFTREVMEACEFELYTWMIKDLPCRRQFLRAMRVISGDNECVFRFFTIFCRAIRMSGEMNTSLGNGFSNYMLLKFLYIRAGNSPESFAAVVEGDDGLFRVRDKRPTAEDFEKLGFLIKLDYRDEIEAASFCGIIFDRQDRINVSDPIAAIITLGWLPNRYQRAKESKRLTILRCKALSMAHQYPGCPIISELAHYILRHTRHLSAAAKNEIYNKNVFNTWIRDLMIDAIKDEKNIPIKRPTDRTRRLVCEQFGISIHDQLVFEEYLRSLDSLQDLDIGVLRKYVPDSWCQYYLNYSDRPTVDDFPDLYFSHLNVVPAEQLIPERD
jgi:hypothetical protein